QFSGTATSSTRFIQRGFDRCAKAALVELGIRNVISVNHHRGRSLYSDGLTMSLIRGHAFPHLVAVNVFFKLVDIESYRFRLVRYGYPRCWSLPPHPLSFIESLRHLPEFMLVRGCFSRPSRQLSMLVGF